MILFTIEIINKLINFKTQKIMMYVFESSRKSERKGYVTVFTNSHVRAIALAVINFAKNGYKGSPVEVIL